MKIGSIVTIVRMNEEGAWIVPDDSAKGVVIAIEQGEEWESRRTLSVTIRWESGKVETKEPEGEDSIGSWEIADATPWLYANLYLHDVAYGGPEEGGWWYDTYEPATDDWNTDPPPHGHFETEDEAEAAYHKLREWCEMENATRRPPSSAASEGHFVVKLEAWPAEFMPKRKPHYC